MIVNQVSSSRTLHPRYALGLVYLLLVFLRPLVIKADLNGVEACQNPCFNRSECYGVGNGLCCQWDDDVCRCISSIGSDLCLGAATMPLPPGSSIDCQLIAMSLALSVHRNLSNNEPESTPSTSPTSHDHRCMNIETELDWYLCIAGFTIYQLKTIIITLKISSALSILGSSYVVQDVLRDPQKRNESTYHRIMLGLSCSDMIVSFFGYFFCLF